MQSKEAVKKYLKEVGGNGHSILKSSYLVEIGFTPEFAKGYTEEHKSGDNYKETLFDKNGNKAESLSGVYALSFIYGIARDMEINTDSARRLNGRGFQAQELARLIQAKLAQ